MSPSQVDETNYLDLEVRANRGLMHPPPFRRLPFKFHTDDEVVLKRTKQQLFKDKVSLTGYDVEEPRFRIQDRSYRLSGRDHTKYLPYYYLVEEERWMAESDLALRQCPHRGGGGTVE